MVNKRTIVLEIPDAIEIHDGEKFAFWANLFGVQVGTRGRKPKAELARAIRDYEGDDLPTTIVDTEYFSADMGDDKPRESSEYGVKLAALRATRDAAIAQAHADFESGRDALRAEYGKSSENGNGKSKATAAFIVSARTPMLDKETGEVLRTNPKGDQPGSVKFLPSPRKVELSMARIRELTGTEGQRGRVSQVDTLRAAVIAGEWFPRDLMSVDGWETVLLKDAKVTAVESSDA